MAIFAVVNSSGGVVSNIIVGEDVEAMKSIVGDVVEITEATGGASIDWTWDPESGKFIPPAS